MTTRRADQRPPGANQTNRKSPKRKAEKMAVYYNENNPRAAAYLRALIEARLIPAGPVDERSIEDVRPSELFGYSQCHFFAGIGGWPLALSLAGWPGDRPVWTGSCPCQPFSQAGKGGGASDDRHLWASWDWLIRQCRPPTVFGEQSASRAGKVWWDQVRTDLERSGYAAAAANLCAASVEAWHDRPRIYFAAHAIGLQQWRQEQQLRAAGRMGRVKQPVSWDRDWRSALREFRGMDDGLSYGVAVLDGFRNAIVPQLAAEFICAAEAASVTARGETLFA